MESKPWYKSRVIWFNLICGGFAIAAANLPIFSGFMTPLHFASFSSFVTLGNAALRLVSSSGITFS